MLNFFDGQCKGSQNHLQNRSYRLCISRAEGKISPHPAHKQNKMVDELLKEHCTASPLAASCWRLSGKLPAEQLTCFKLSPNTNGFNTQARRALLSGYRGCPATLLQA